MISKSGWKIHIKKMIFYGLFWDFWVKFRIYKIINEWEVKAKKKMKVESFGN